MKERGAAKELLKAVNLTVGYGKKKEAILFENINVELKAGQLVCFMGPNGVGKSSLIRTLTGLQPPLSGSVFCKDEPLTPANAATQVAVVLTDKIPTQNLTVRELVQYGRYPFLNWSLKLQESDLSIIDAAIQALGLGHIIDKRLDQLSDGQLQMALIARAIAQSTDIILLDEPTAHLDLDNRVDIMNMLRTTARNCEKAILVATHELDLALQTADHIWLAGHSRNLLCGLPEDLVLNGSFDEIFRFKGYDLKTGKVYHHPFRNITIKLEGTNFEYLWTKNALERNGYAVNDQGFRTIVAVESHSNGLTWVIKNDDEMKRVKTIKELLSILELLE